MFRKWRICISCRNGVCVAEREGYTYNISVAEMWGICYRNGGYVSVAEMRVCISCRNGGFLTKLGARYVCEV